MCLARSFFLLAALVVVVRMQAQQNDVPLQREIYVDVERNAAKLDARIHSGLKPLIESRADLTHVMGHRPDSGRYYYKLTEKIFKEHLLIVDEGDFHLTVDPLFQLEVGYDKGDVTTFPDTSRYLINVRGFWIAGNITKKVSFQTMFHENQTLLPQYLLRYTYDTGVLPGQGRTKYKNDRVLDFGWSQGNVSYSPTAWLNVQLGHGKHFVGHGYRSVLLSDNALNTPYVQFSVLPVSKRWQYTTWHTKLMHGVTKYDRLPTGESSESLFYWMRGRFNHLSVDMGRVQLGLFESTLFRTIDSAGVRPFDPLELNPVIGVNLLAKGFGKPDKELVGLDLRVKVKDKVYAYGQFATDGPGHAAWQAGFRAFDVLRKDLHVQVEYNTATPFMYQSTPVKQAYMHAGQPLAHPLGTAFGEFVAIVDAGFGRFWFQGKVNMATYERDAGVDYNDGNDLNKPDRATPAPDGPISRQLFYLDVNASYLINPNTNLRFVIGCWRRDAPGTGDVFQSTFYHAGVSTSLFNRYYDL